MCNQNGSAMIMKVKQMSSPRCNVSPSIGKCAAPYACTQQPYAANVGRAQSTATTEPGHGGVSCDSSAKIWALKKRAVGTCPPIVSIAPARPT